MALSATAQAIALGSGFASNDEQGSDVCCRQASIPTKMLYLINVNNACFPYTSTLSHSIV